MKDILLLGLTVGIIMTLGLIFVNESCKAYNPAPTTQEYMNELSRGY